MMESKNRKAIREVLIAFTRENENLLSQIYELVYFYRGGITYEEAMNMSPGERDIATRWVNKRIEAAAKMPIPIY